MWLAEGGVLKGGGSLRTDGERDGTVCARTVQGWAKVGRPLTVLLRGRE